MTRFTLATVAVYALLRGHDYAVPFLLLMFGFGMGGGGLAQDERAAGSHTLRRRTRASVPGRSATACKGLRRLSAVTDLELRSHCSDLGKPHIEPATCEVWNVTPVGENEQAADREILCQRPVFNAPEVEDQTSQTPGPWLVPWPPVDPEPVVRPGSLCLSGLSRLGSFVLAPPGRQLRLSPGLRAMVRTHAGFRAAWRRSRIKALRMIEADSGWVGVPPMMATD